MKRSLTLACLALCLLAFSAFIPADDEARPAEQNLLLLKYSHFDPLAGEPAMLPSLRGGADTNLWLVQFDGKPTDALRAAVAEMGGEITWYMPHNAYVVRMGAAVGARVARVAGVRSVSHYHPAFRLETFLVAEIAGGDLAPTRKYNIVVVDRTKDKPTLTRAIQALGGEVTHQQPTSILLEVALDGAALAKAARLDQVLWIDRWSAPEEDMNNARIQGGGNYIETAGAYTGKGVNGHLYEGCEATHPDFNTPATNVLSGGGADSHGHCTAGIIFGNGKSNPLGRGMAPDAKPYFTQYGSVTSGYSRKQVIGELVTKHDVMFTTASWGGSRVTTYTSTSASTDDIIFTHDIPWTQSQSNASTQMSRPEAWAKNIFSIGGVKHYDNADRNDDSWRAGGGSTGPAADGRIKPDLCAYYDAILCSDRSGTAGYSSGNYYTNFGGTSGATPICAGHNALALQMFTDHIFNNTPKVPNGTRFQNRPHFTTLKVLQIANARQYPFTSASTDNRREHVGWGFPDLQTMYDNRSRMFLVDETDVLTQGSKKTYQITVKQGDPELKIAMSFADPAGNPSASLARINDLTLKVTAPDNTVYWGNNGLKLGNYSVAGGSANTVDTVECVFVSKPAPGTWTVEVIATLVAADSHKETPAVDADFALCVGYGTRVAYPVVQDYGKGCVGTGKLPAVGPTLNPNGGTLNAGTRTYRYAYPVTTTSAITVTGFQLFTGRASGTATVATALHLASGTLPSNTAAATSTMKVDAKQAFYETKFTTPVNIPANTTFFLVCDHTSCYVSTLTSGTARTCYYYYSYYGTWRTSSFAKIPSYKVLIQGAGQPATPMLAASGSGRIGSALTHEVTQAVPSTSAVMVWGISDKQWGTYNLPLDMALYGAPGCNLLTSVDLLGPLAIDANGYGKTQLTVPAKTELLGENIYQQAVILDLKANALGVAVTNGIKVTLGN